MEQITKWRNNKNQISDHKIEIGSLNEQIGEHREKISMLDNDNRETPYYWVSQWVKNNLISYEKSFEDSVSQGQYDSKIWLRDELKKQNFEFIGKAHIEIIGSWFAFPLLEIIKDLYPVKQVDLYDKDENCHRVTAQYINHFDPDFKIVQYGDYFERKDKRRRHLVINTACEHMQDIGHMRHVYKGTPTMVLQSNNYTEQEDHINCVNNVNELIYKNKLAHVNYSGYKSFENYDRFMVIGAWLN